jgi:hypothetical protein
VIVLDSMTPIFGLGNYDLRALIGFRSLHHRNAVRPGLLVNLVDALPGHAVALGNLAEGILRLAQIGDHGARSPRRRPRTESPDINAVLAGDGVDAAIREAESRRDVLDGPAAQHAFDDRRIPPMVLLRLRGQRGAELTAGAAHPTDGAVQTIGDFMRRFPRSHALSRVPPQTATLKVRHDGVPFVEIAHTESDRRCSAFGAASPKTKSAMYLTFNIMDAVNSGLPDRYVICDHKKICITNKNLAQKVLTRLRQLICFGHDVCILDSGFWDG